MRTEIGEAVEIDHVWRGCRQERRVRRGRNLSDLFDQLHVFRFWTKLIVADQRGEGSSTEDAEFLFVNFLEERALVELGRSLQIAEQFSLLDVEDFDLQRFTGLALVEEVAQPAPASFQLLE